MPNTEVRRPLERSANYAFCFSVRSGNFYSTISIISGKTFTRIKGSANPHKTYPRPIKNRLFSGKPKICEGPFSNYAGTEKNKPNIIQTFFSIVFGNFVATRLPKMYAIDNIQKKRPT